jgi:outer membrane immunogenic protein
VTNRNLSSRKLTVAALAFASLTITALSTPLQAQAHPEVEKRPSPEISLQYTYVRSNAPVAECGCFSLNGGSASIAQPLGRGHIAAVFEATVAHGSISTPASSTPVDTDFTARPTPKADASTSASTYDLTLTVLTAGARYRPLLHSKWNPFGQILIGVANANGSLVEGNTPAANDSPLNFASQVGGGLDYRMGNRLGGRLSLRIFEANYLVTTSTNGVNDHQNNLFLSSGITYRFRKP